MGRSEFLRKCSVNVQVFSEHLRLQKIRRAGIGLAPTLGASTEGLNLVSRDLLSASTGGMTGYTSPNAVFKNHLRLEKLLGYMCREVTRLVTRQFPFSRCLSVQRSSRRQYTRPQSDTKKPNLSIMPIQRGVNITLTAIAIAPAHPFLLPK